MRRAGRAGRSSSAHFLFEASCLRTRADHVNLGSIGRARIGKVMCPAVRVDGRISSIAGTRLLTIRVSIGDLPEGMALVLP